MMRTHSNISGSRRVRVGREAGLGSVEVLPIGLLVMTAMTFVVMSAWSVVDAKMGVIGAARQAARVTVEQADRQAGQAAGIDAWAATGRSAQLSLAISGTIRRCGRVVATASVDLAPIPLGFFDDWQPITVRSTHSEVVDPYRGTLDGVAEC
jgi:hypothetical protein